jgi:hypothetical protein
LNLVLEKFSKNCLDTFAALSVKAAVNFPNLSDDNPEQIRKIVERLAELLTPHLPARGRLASLGAGTLAKAAAT